MDCYTLAQVPCFAYVFITTPRTDNHVNNVFNIAGNVTCYFDSFTTFKFEFLPFNFKCLQSQYLDILQRVTFGIFCISVNLAFVSNFFEFFGWRLLFKILYGSKTSFIRLSLFRTCKSFTIWPKISFCLGL